MLFIKNSALIFSTSGFSAIRKGYNNPNPVRQYPSASPHKHLPKPALFSKNPVLHLQGHSDKAYFYQETSGFIFFRLIFIMFQYLSSSPLLVAAHSSAYSNLPEALQASNIPAINNIQSNLNRTFILVYSFKDTFPSHFPVFGLTDFHTSHALPTINGSGSNPQ